MPMPKASMNKDDGFVFGKHDIRFAWKVLDVETETVALSMEVFAHQDFWLGVGAADAAHVI